MRMLLPFLTVSLATFISADGASSAEPANKSGAATNAAAPAPPSKTEPVAISPERAAALKAAQEKRAQLVKARREKLQRLALEGAECRKRKDYRGSIRVATQVLELVPNNYKWLSYRAHAYACLEKRSQAVADYTACLAIKPTAEHYEMRAALCRAMGEPGAALKDISEAIKLSPLTRYYTNKARFHMEFGDDDKALAELKKGLSVLDNEPEGSRLDYEIQCYETIGIAYLQKNDAKNALQAFSKVLDLTRGWKEANSKNDKTALLQFADKYSFRLLWRGEAYEKTGKLKEAIADYELAVKAKPKDFNYRKSLLRAYRKAGQNEKALSLVSELLQEDDSPDLYYKRADLYKKLGKESLANIDLVRARKSEHGLMGSFKEK